MLAAIDIGSNTVQMQIADIESGKLVIRKNYLQTSRLGQVCTPGVLSEQAICSTAQIICDFMRIVEEQSIKHIRIIATSAVRDASNKEQFLTEIKKMAPSAPKIEILTGAQEARLSYLGASSSFEFDVQIPVIDQGGSSTELIIADQDGLKTHSANIGAVRAHRYGWKKTEIFSFVQKEFKAEADSGILCGVGGTITTAAGLCLGLKEYQREAINAYRISKQQIDELILQLQVLSLEQRCAFSPLLAKRGEIILEGLWIWQSLLEVLNSHTVIVSGGGILDGVMQEMLIDIMK